MGKRRMGKPGQKDELRLDARPSGEGVVRGILDQRGQVYGPFIHNAITAQALKSIVRQAPQWASLEDDQAEAIDVICSKIARIVSSSHAHIDNWDDIAGYSCLVADKLRGCK